MLDKGAEKRTIIRFKNRKLSSEDDLVASEVHIRVTLQCEVIGTLTCTPTNIHELVAGYLVTSGLVNEENKLLHLEYIEGESKFDVTLENNNILEEKEYSVVKPLGCASGDILFIRAETANLKMPPIEITAETISDFMREFNKSSELFLDTGGVHSCALANNKKIIVSHDDVGRHNAVDKVVGSLYLKKQSYAGLILLTTGRISSEIVLKAINARLSMIVSRSAPTVKGIELAQQYGLALVGFARGGNFNIYTCPESIIP